jgi:hypothetical protein
MNHHRSLLIREELPAKTLVIVAILVQGCSATSTQTVIATPKGESGPAYTSTTFAQTVAKFCETPGASTIPGDTAASARTSDAVSIIETVDGDAHLPEIEVPPLRCLVRDSTQWNLIRPMFAKTNWVTHTFDFTKVQIVIAAHGLAMSTGPRIKIARIQQLERITEVHVFNIQLSTCIVGHTERSPFSAAVIPRNAAPVQFREWLVVHECD